MKPRVFLGLSGAILIVARGRIPTMTPDRFKQANTASKIGVAKMGVTIDFCLCVHPPHVPGMLLRCDDTPGQVSDGLRLWELSASDRLLLDYRALEQSELERA
jgi:hypothetical protein